jgi:prepilin-type N-terminal cleavage/methylation domain-containing protein
VTRREGRTDALEQRSDAGLSLAELLVAIMVFGLIMTIVSTTFISLTKATSQSRTIDNNTRVASNGLNDLSLALRGARTIPVETVGATDLPAFSSATRESVRFYTAANLVNTTSTVPRQVEFSLSANRSLVERSLTGTTNAKGFSVFAGTATSRTVTTPMATTPSGGPWLFTYLDATGAPLPFDATGALGTDDLGSIAAVQVTVRIDSTTTMTPQGITLQNTVGLPNLTFGGSK